MLVTTLRHSLPDGVRAAEGRQSALSQSIVRQS